MSDVSFTSLAVVLAVAFGSRLVLGLLPQVRLPGVVVEIVLGIVVGPAVLGWAEADDVVRILAVVGLAFLLFLSGLELDLRRLRGPIARLAGAGFGVSLALAAACGLALAGLGLVEDPLLAAVVLTATSLGLVVPTLAEAGQGGTRLGQLVIAGASIGDFAAILLLSALFSADGTSAGTKLVFLAEFTTVVALLVAAIALTGRSTRLAAVLARLQDTTAEIRVRAAVLLVVVLVVLAEHFGLEAILGAFVAGAVVGAVDRDAGMTHPHFRLKLEAIGYGFLVPVFFVASGIAFDLHALTGDPSTLTLVPVFLAALVVARGVPALVYRPLVGSRGAAAAGLLQATSLPFIVTATQIGVDIGALDRSTAAAFVAAGLASALLFPAVALALLRSESARTVTSARPPWSVFPALAASQRAARATAAPSAQPQPGPPSTWGSTSSNQ